ncbi:MAG: SapB/AmfS family lanthipeptide [Lentilactobacillus buchneri]|nr:SapB/AmfS family lanthipeptide [Lentilactobacillus buchneri]MCI1950776.1 SapB/AmfS family lanthipeptide [Lentilactobacillus buchneri]MCI2019400.1 SapB/AmfS family lanthipeptide [Lentilactobacillus buchneri]MCI2028028.1 SapB/AmfS family lanthipeptide [Lentilactobacillus buchneri]
MDKKILDLQNVKASEDNADEVDGVRFSMASTYHCGNWSWLSLGHC